MNFLYVDLNLLSQTTHTLFTITLTIMLLMFIQFRLLRSNNEESL